MLIMYFLFTWSSGTDLIPCILSHIVNKHQEWNNDVITMENLNTALTYVDTMVSGN